MSHSAHPLRAALALDLRLQWRYGFHYAAAFSTVLWAAVLLALPDRLLGPAMPYVIFGDLAIVGFFFIAGAVFFEKGERTVFALLVTPLRFREYLAAKLISLTLLAVVVSLAVTLVDYGIGFQLPALLAGVVLISLVMLLAGLLSALPFPSISDWLLPSSLVIAVLSLPLIPYSGLWHHPAFALLPTHGPLRLLGAAFGQAELGPAELLYAVGYPLLWVAGLGVLAARAFQRFVSDAAGAQ